MGAFSTTPMALRALALSFAAIAGACGSNVGRFAEIPSPSGNDRAPIALNAGADELARRAAAERERGQPGRALRFARWALALEPEHPGALVIVARIASDSEQFEVARRHFELASSLGPAVADAVKVERRAQLLAYARAELAAGRVEQSAALMEEIEAQVPTATSAERRQAAALYGELADTWLARELAGPAKAAADRAAALGADGEHSRLRSLLAEVIAAGKPTAADAAASGLGAFEPRLQAELGRNVERWLALAAWGQRSGRFSAAAWAAERAIGIDPERASASLAVADAYAGLRRERDAIDAYRRAAGLMGPVDGAAMLARVAGRLEGSSFQLASTELARAAAALAPGSDGGVQAACLLAAMARGQEARDAALRVLDSAARAAPNAWQRLAAPMLTRGDLHAVARVLAAARESGLVDWVGHAFEAAHWRAVLAGSGTPELRAEAGQGSAAAFDAALAAKPGFFGLLELARIAAGDPARAEKVRAAAEREGQPSAASYLAAVEARGDLARARARLESALAERSAFEQAFTRAHFELEAGEPGRALALAEAALRAASPTELAAAEAFALRLAFNAPSPKLEARARSWLAAGVDPMVVEAPYRGQNLVRLLGAARGNPELQLQVVEAVLAEPMARWSTSLDDAKTTRRSALVALGRWDEADASWHAEREDERFASAIAVMGDRRAEAEIDSLLVKLAQENPDRMVRLAAQLHPAEIGRRDALGELVKHLLARQEPYRARRVVEHVLGLPDGEGIGSARLQILAQELLDAGEVALAVRAFERVVGLGERSPKVYQGWLRALLRLGDAARADEVAARAIEARPRRDARSLEDVARVFYEEGRLGRAIELLRARVEDNERVEPSTFNALADLLARSGRGAELGPIARRFIASDPRGTQRLQAVAVTRLIELGALEEAKAIVDEALAAKLRDPQLLTVATSLALIRGQDDAEAVAERLLREAGGAFDVWDRIIGDVRSSTRSEAAVRILTGGLERFAGAHRLLLLRGRVQLLAGQGEAAFQDFAEALARAPSPRDVIDPLEPLLARMSRFEQLADLEARALALVPGRADTTLALGRALIAAGRVDDAAQAFARVVAETDRAHGLVADAWFEAGHLGLAVDGWAKVEPTLTEDAVAMLDKVSSALAQRGEASRLDTFVRLYLQALRGSNAPPLLPIAAAFRKVGRPQQALEWLERADRDTPSVESVLELMRLRLAMGDERGALLAAERVVTRRLALAPPARFGGSVVGPALEPLALELTTAGQPGLARDLALRVASMHGASTATRLVAARAMLVEGDLAGALEVLDAPFEPWRQQRDLLGLLRDVLSGLVERGHLEAALAVVLRAVEVSGEREILLGAMRIAARAGDGPTVLRLGRRLAALAPASNTWLVGDLLASERLARSSVAPLTLALDQTSDTALKFSAIALALGPGVGPSRGAGGAMAGLDAVLARAPRVAEDRVERALIEGFAASVLPDVSGPGRAARAFQPALRRATVDPALVKVAALMGSLSDDAALADVWRALRSVSSDETKLRLQVGAHLAAAKRWRSALVVYDGLLDSEGGDGALALDVFALALQAGDETRARRWADKALGRIPSAAPSLLRNLFADKAAELGAAALATSLLGDEPADSWRKMQVKARLALLGGDLEGFRAAVERRLLLSPDEAVARAETALMALAIRGGAGSALTPEREVEARRWAAEAARLLDPLVREEDAPALALELAFAATRELATARALFDRLRTHYPGALLQPALVLQAALGLEDAALVGQVLGSIAPEPRRAALLQLVDARIAAGGRPPAPAVSRLLEIEVDRASPTDRTAVALDVALARLAGDARAAAQAAESAVARAPWSSELSILLAQTLAETGRDGARAEGILRSVMARPSELGLFDAEQRYLVPLSSWRAWEALSVVQAWRGEQAAARRSLDRAHALAPDSDTQRLWLMQRRLADGDESDAAMRSCVALARAPWSALCDARLR